jgi:hypothetical protein
LREAQLDEQPGASLLLGMYLCTCTTISDSMKVLRDTPLASFS